MHAADNFLDTATTHAIAASDLLLTKANPRYNPSADRAVVAQAHATTALAILALLDRMDVEEAGIAQDTVLLAKAGVADVRDTAGYAREQAAREAEAKGWTVDRHVDPWLVYSGPRFAPDAVRHILLDGTVVDPGR